MVIIISHVLSHFSHLPAAACRGRKNQSKVDKHAGKNPARANSAPEMSRHYVHRDLLFVLSHYTSILYQ